MEEKQKQAEKPVESQEPQVVDEEYKKELMKARELEEAEPEPEPEPAPKPVRKKKKPASNDEDYFDYQWIGADPGEKK